MKLFLRTRVEQDFKTVFANFDRTLFLNLAPPYPRLNLLRFDGCRTGDAVEIELKTGFSKHRWTSLITDHQENEYESYFVDEGQELPSPLTLWRHKHIMSSNGSKTIISDQIEYSTGKSWLDVLLYPLFYVQFVYRKPIYKKYFSKKHQLK